MDRKLFLLPALLLTIGLSTAYCGSSSDNVFLARQSYQLSKKLDELSYIQTESGCVDYLGFASLQLEMAGASIINQEYQYAINQINEAICGLIYTEVMNCKNGSDIAIVKNQAIEIKSQIDQ